MEPVLVSFSNSYSKLDLISVSASGLSLSLISHYLLTISATNYCSKRFVNNFVLRKMFYFRQSLRNTCYSLAYTDYK